MSTNTERTLDHYPGFARTSGGLIPYCYDDTGRLRILMKEGPDGYLHDFGGYMDLTDASPLHCAARHFAEDTHGAFHRDRIHAVERNHVLDYAAFSDNFKSRVPDDIVLQKAFCSYASVVWDFIQQSCSADMIGPVIHSHSGHVTYFLPVPFLESETIAKVSQQSGALSTVVTRWLCLPSSHWEASIAKLHDKMDREALLTALNKMTSPPSGKDKQQRATTGKKPLPLYAFFNCEDATEMKGFEAIWLSYVQDPDEEWRVYHLFNNEFPSAEDMNRLKGVVISGSQHSVHEDAAWIRRLTDFVANVGSRSDIRVVGACFGAEMVAASLGGCVSPTRDGRFVFKMQVIDLLDDFYSWICVKVDPQLEAAKPTTVRVAHAHGDMIDSLPPQSRVLARTECCDIDIFLANESVLGSAGHPEYGDFVMKNVFPDMKSKLKNADEVAEVETSLQFRSDGPLLLEVFRRFLKATK